MVPSHRGKSVAVSFQERQTVTLVPGWKNIKVREAEVRLFLQSRKIAREKDMGLLKFPRQILQAPPKALSLHIGRFAADQDPKPLLRKIGLVLPKPDRFQ